MINVVLIIYASLASVAILLYLPKIVGFSFGFRKTKRYRATCKRSICVVVPARNESNVIVDLLPSIQRQNYDKSCYEVHVIVKEHDDPTVQIARSFGYNTTVIEPQQCKGDALDGFFKSLTAEQLSSFDAYVIVDADGVLTEDYLSNINDALESDADIVVTCKLAKNFLKGKQYRSLYSNCSALTWPILDDLGNAYRTKKGMPLNLCGQGLLVTRRVIAELGGWPYRTVTEDYELKLDGGILRGYKSVYYPYAVLYTEEAVGRQENFHRRVRWLTGYSQCDSKYKRQIKRQVRSNRRLTRGEAEYFFGNTCYAIFLVATVFSVISGLALTAYYAVIGSNLWYFALLLLCAMPLGVLYLILHVFTIVALCVSSEVRQSMTVMERIGLVYYNPIYLIEYVVAYFVGLYQLHIKKKVEWKQRSVIVPDDK